jgi:PhoH-like ATPase
MVYVLDTSVLLSDPKAFERLKDKDLVIPLVVITELESKRNHPELGFAAREALRTLEKYRKSQNIIEKVQNSSNGSIKVEINNIFDSELPNAFKDPTNDNKILAVASNLAKTEPVTLLTKDLPLRLKASVAGLCADDYLPDEIIDNWSGLLEINVTERELNDLYEDDEILVPEDIESIFENACLIVKSPFGSALARKVDKRIVRVNDRAVFGLRGRSAEQKLALDMLNDPDIGIVSIGGSAGTGKSLLALAAGLEAVMERRSHRRVVVFRPLYAVGGQDLGYLPGTAEEKMSPWAAAVFDALEVFCGSNVIDHVIENGLLEVLPLTHIRGRTLTDTFVIVDEAQNLEKMVLLTALTRIGENSKVILTHDVAQRDNLRVGKYDGITSVISALVGEELFGHITLTKSERSPVAELVSHLLDE